MTHDNLLNNLGYFSSDKNSPDIVFFFLEFYISQQDFLEKKYPPIW